MGTAGAVGSASALVLVGRRGAGQQQAEDVVYGFVGTDCNAVTSVSSRGRWATHEPGGGLVHEPDVESLPVYCHRLGMTLGGAPLGRLARPSRPHRLVDSGWIAIYTAGYSD